MNNYFDQQWDQSLAEHPRALQVFTGLSAAEQQRIVSYVQSCDDTWEADRRCRAMMDHLENGTPFPKE